MTCEGKRGNEDDAEVLAEWSVLVLVPVGGNESRKRTGPGKGEDCCVIAAEMTMEEKPADARQRIKGERGEPGR